MTNGIGRVGWRNYVSPLPNPLWNGMLAYYTGDNTADDAKGTAHGTLTNGATYGTGKINGGFSFDGINDTVTLSNTVTKFSSSTPFTYNVWVKAVSRTGFIYMDANATTAGTAIGFLGGALAFAIGDVAQWFGTSVVIPLNTWTMVTITYNGIVNQSNNLLFYTNGTLAQGLKMDVSFSLPNASSNKQIGSGGWRIYFNGNIDELGIWGRELTTAEVTELYNAGAGKQYVSPTPTYTTRTAAFATATGITDTTILNALNTFDTGLISNGLATKMKALYPFVGGTSNTHKFNFMDARDVDAAFRLAFNGGWVHSSTGALPNGTNGYADTYFKPSNSTYTNFGWGFYLTTNSVGVYNEFGFWAPGQVVYGYPNLDGSFYIKYGGNDLDGSGGNTIGFHSYNQSSNQMKRFKNGILTHTFPNVPSNLSLANVSYFIAARNNSGTGGQFSNRSRTFQYISDGLTDTEASTLYTLTQALQTSLGRQV